MVLRSVSSCPTLPAAVDQPLAEMLRRAQLAVRARTRLRRDAVWWEVAEGWTATELARRDPSRTVPGGPRVLLAVAVAAHLAGRGAEPWPEDLEVGDMPYEGGVDLALSGAESACGVLGDSVCRDDDLADAWTAVCGVELLRVLAKARVGAEGLDGPVAAIRIAQRATIGRVTLSRSFSESSLARLACVDRRTVALWRQFRGPAVENTGFMVTAAECAEFAGTSTKTWRELSAGGHAPPFRARRRTTLVWDEAEVLRWIDGYVDESGMTGHAVGRMPELRLVGSRSVRWNGDRRQPADATVPTGTR